MEDDDAIRSSQAPTILGRIWSAFRVVSLEIFLFLTQLSMALEKAPFQDLLKVKACYLHFNLTDDQCRNLTANNSDINHVRNDIYRMASNYNLYAELLMIGSAVLVGSFIGPWSDKHGRKIPLVISSIGGILQSIGIIINIIYFRASLSYLLLPSLPAGLLGGFLTIMGTTYSVTTENSGTSSRTLRFYFLEMCFVVAQPLGTFAGGQLFERYDYLGVFVASVIVLLAALTVACFAVHDPHRSESDFSTMLRDFFTLESMKDNFRTCVKWRPNRIRAQLWLLMLSLCAIVLSYNALDGIAYYFAQRMYNWTLVRYSNISAILRVCTTVAAVILIVVATQVLKVPDPILGCVGSLSQVAQNVILFFARTEWLYYTAFIAGVASPAAPIAIRSRMSKLISRDELGKVFSILATVETIIPLVGTTVFVQLFNYALDTFAGLPYLSAAVLLTLPAFVFVWIIRLKPVEYQTLRQCSEEGSGEDEHFSKKPV